MPTYEYRCKDCEGSFELVQSFSDDTLVKCPGKRAGGPMTESCTKPGMGKVVKVFGSVGIAFKGDGFYKNDHGTKKPSSTTESTSETSSSSSSDSSSSSTSSDSTPEKKSESKKPEAKKSKPKASKSSN